MKSEPEIKLTLENLSKLPKSPMLTKLKEQSVKSITNNKQKEVDASGNKQKQKGKKETKEVTPEHSVDDDLPSVEDYIQAKRRSDN